MSATLHGRLIITGDFNNRSFALAVPLVNGSGISSHPLPLRHGDGLRVFNSIAGGDVLSSFTINLENRSGEGLVQKDTPLKQWTSYFCEQMAVTVERAGMAPMQGSLINPSDNLGRSLLWAFAPFDGSGDVDLQNGDRVTLYRFVKDGHSILDTKIVMKPERKQRGTVQMNGQGPHVLIMFTQTVERPPHEQMEQFCARGYPVAFTR